MVQSSSVIPVAGHDGRCATGRRLAGCLQRPHRQVVQRRCAPRILESAHDDLSIRRAKPEHRLLSCRSFLPPPRLPRAQTSRPGCCRAAPAPRHVKRRAQIDVSTVERCPRTVPLGSSFQHLLLFSLVLPNPHAAQPHSCQVPCLMFEAGA